MKKLFIYITFIILSINASGQIFAPEADYVDTTQYIYSDTLGVDSIYVFFSPGYQGYPIEVDLQANYNDSTGLNFTWKKFNPQSYLYEEIVNPVIEINEDSSKCIIKNIESGGYEVHILREDDIDTTFHAWIFENYLVANIEVDATCNYTRLSGINGGNTFYYYDWIDSSSIVIENGLKIEWTADPEPDNELRPLQSLTLIPPHYEDTEFRVHVIDSFGYEKEDLKTVTAVATKADFNAFFGFDILDTTKTQEAPFTVQFEDSAKNAGSYHWVFFNDLEVPWTGKDTLLGESFMRYPLLPEIDEDSIIYYRPGNYDVKLIVTGPEYRIDQVVYQCIDSITKVDYIKVDSSQINMDLPNVFSPDGDGQNDIFHFKEVKTGSSGFEEYARSIRSFEIRIYNRWGKKIYEYEDMDGEWEGWNGEIKGDGTMVEPGVYFYVFRGVGWDKRIWEEKKFLHVFYSK